MQESYVLTASAARHAAKLGIDVARLTPAPAMMIGDRVEVEGAVFVVDERRVIYGLHGVRRELRLDFPVR